MRVPSLPGHVPGVSCSGKDLMILVGKNEREYHSLGRNKPEYLFFDGKIPCCSGKEPSAVICNVGIHPT